MAIISMKWRMKWRGIGENNEISNNVASIMAIISINGEMAWRRRKWQHGEKWRNWHQLSEIMPKEIINVAKESGGIEMKMKRNENERIKIMAMNRQAK
jgi:hypothetical protein